MTNTMLIILDNSQKVDPTLYASAIASLLIMAFVFGFALRKSIYEKSKQEEK